MYPNRKKRNAFCWQFQWYAWEFTCFPRRKISVLYRFLYAKFHEFSFHKHDLCFFRNSSKNTIEISLRKSSFGFCYYSRCLCYINRHATREIDSTHTHYKRQFHISPHFRMKVYLVQENHEQCCIINGSEWLLRSRILYSFKTYTSSKKFRGNSISLIHRSAIVSISTFNFLKIETSRLTVRNFQLIRYSVEKVEEERYHFRYHMLFKSDVPRSARKLVTSIAGVFFQNSCLEFPDSRGEGNWVIASQRKGGWLQGESQS